MREFTLQQASQEADVFELKLYRAIQKGELKAHRVRSQIFIKEHDLVEYLIKLEEEEDKANAQR